MNWFQLDSLSFFEARKNLVSYAVSDVRIVRELFAMMPPRCKVRVRISIEEGSPICRKFKSNMRPGEAPGSKVNGAG